MAIVTVPTESGVCKIIGQMADKDIVLATSEDDFRDWSVCELGAKIEEAPEMVGDAYDYLVLNPGTDCIERYPKPPPPVYNSELLNPWFGEKAWQGQFQASNGLHANQTLNLPTFTYDVNLMAIYTIGILDDKVEWTPGGPIRLGASRGTSYEDYEIIPVVKLNSGDATRTFSRMVFVKAGQAGLKLGIYLNGGGGAGWSHHSVWGFSTITAVAFKA